VIFIDLYLMLTVAGHQDIHFGLWFLQSQIILQVKNNLSYIPMLMIFCVNILGY